MNAIPSSLKNNLRKKLLPTVFLPDSADEGVELKNTYFSKITKRQFAEKGFGILKDENGDEEIHDFSHVRHSFKPEFKPEYDSPQTELLLPRGLDFWRELKPNWLESFEKRLNQLKTLSKDEDLSFNKLSSVCARNFVQKTAAYARPSIFLLTNGNIRLLWENSQNEQVGLQFMGNKQIQYVIFVQRDGLMAELMGVDKIVGVQRLLKDQGIRKIVTS